MQNPSEHGLQNIPNMTPGSHPPSKFNAITNALAHNAPTEHDWGIIGSGAFGVIYAVATPPESALRDEHDNAAIAVKVIRSKPFLAWHELMRPGRPPYSAMH
eukprot:8372440-Pyramimonas_sp.AAC.1